MNWNDQIVDTVKTIKDVTKVQITVKDNSLIVVCMVDPYTLTESKLQDMYGTLQDRLTEVGSCSDYKDSWCHFQFKIEEK